MIKRCFYHYNLWECYLNGMYRIKEEDGDDILIIKSACLLKDLDNFYSVGLIIIKKWKHSASHNLSNSSRNKQAYIGQASCSFSHKAPEFITKIAWRGLTVEQQNLANDVADKIIIEWQQQQTIDINQIELFEVQNA